MRKLYFNWKWQLLDDGRSSNDVTEDYFGDRFIGYNRLSTNQEFEDFGAQWDANEGNWYIEAAS